MVADRDIGYNLDDDCGAVGDAFMYDIEPSASAVPWMFGPGNHEVCGMNAARERWWMEYGFILCMIWLW